MTKAHEATEAAYRAIHDAAYTHLQFCMELWDRSGRPIGDVRALNPAAPERRMKHFKVLPVAWPGFRWCDMETPGSGGNDLISLVEWLAQVDRPRAARFLAEH